MDNTIFADNEPILRETEIIRTSTEFHCQRICQKTDKCTHFTWISPFKYAEEYLDWGINQCILRTSGKFPIEGTGMISGPVRCNVHVSHVEPDNQHNIFCQQPEDTSECRCIFVC